MLMTEPKAQWHGGAQSVTGFEMANAPKVLVVEDEFLIAVELQRILEGAWASPVYIARSCAEGAAEARRQKFDLAIVSIGPEPQLAVDLIRSLLADGLSVVAVSSDGSHQHGIPDLPGIPCVVKPFSDEEVVAALRAAGKAPLS